MEKIKIAAIQMSTVADKMENQIPETIKHKRFDRLKELFETQVEENNKKYEGIASASLWRNSLRNG